MGYRFDNHYKLCISTVENLEEVFELLSTMPADRTMQMKMSYKVFEIDGEPDIKITSVEISFTSLYLKQYESALYDWAMEVVKLKQKERTETQTRYGLFQFNMDTDTSMFGLDSYDLLWRSDYSRLETPPVFPTKREPLEARSPV